MDNRKPIYALCALYTVALLIITYLLQTYQLTYREEADIFFYDSDYMLSAVMRPGGVAMLLASFCSQFFVYSWTGPLIVAVIYAVIILCLMSVFDKGKPVLLPVTALAVMPCLCLMLCFENMSFRTYGLTAFMICVVSLALYGKLAHVLRPFVRLAFGSSLCVIIYWAAGSSALMSAVSYLVLDCCYRRRLWLAGFIYPLLTSAVAYASYYCGYLPTLKTAFTPDMYYEMGSTFYMMLYAMCLVPLYIIVVFVTASLKIRLSVTMQCSAAVVIMCIAFLLAFNLYGAVHSRSNYETQQQRYYARHGQWDEILKMPYHGEQTPYTSYRFLALAHKGQLAENIGGYRPFITYLLENKPKVKRIDQQIYSDIYYDCDYMAAARKAAFDTNIVTPGAFNPYETLKLAEINIVFGDYAVADKLLTLLERTLYYSRRAKECRKLLYDDVAVDSDPVLGPKRRAIPADNGYMSPKGILRDLKYIIDSNDSQQTAREFYKAFKLLTYQHEDI